MQRSRAALLWTSALALLVAPACRGERNPVEPEVASHQAPSESPPRPACELCKADRAWVDRSVSAWHDAAESISLIGGVDRMQAVFFDAQCVLTSATAMASRTGQRDVWDATPHEGSIQLPNRDEMPAGVASFAQATDGPAYLAMSTPSVWRQGNVDGGVLGLEMLMTGVLLHEGTHVVQMPTYGAAMTVLAERNTLPDSFNDDSIQQRFEADEAFSLSVAEETDLLFAAAVAEDLGEARRLAGEARNKIRARHERWFVGEDEYLAEAEDLWMTLEGSGQWVGYTWVVGQVGAEDALRGFGRRSKWWTQNEGLGLFVALDRLGFDWKPDAFGSGERTVLQMLDLALMAPAP